MPLLNGTLGFRIKPESIVYDKDKEAEAIAWAKENAPECVTVKTMKTLSRTALKDVLATRGEDVLDARTGEILGFAAAIPAENVFYVKAGE